MQLRESTVNWLTIVVLWAALATAFVALQQDTSWSLLFPATGLAWTAGPLIGTRFPTRSLVVGSLVALVAVGWLFLALVWLAVEVLGFLASLAIESVGEPDGDRLALELALEGLKLFAGGALGVVIGVILRRWNLVPRPRSRT